MTIGDHYPAGMSACDSNGINGNCGPECSAFLSGDCDVEDEIVENLTPEDIDQLIDDGWMPSQRLPSCGWGFWREYSE